jgi:hypothetical protein
LTDHDPAAAVDLAVALAPFWDSTSALSEARHWLEVVTAVPGTPWPGHASASTWAAYFAALQGDLDAAERLASTALAVWDTHDIDVGRGYALLMLGFTAVERGETQKGEELLRASAEALHRGGDRWGMARPLNNLGELARTRNDLDTAERLHGQALAIARDLGDLSSQPSMLCGLGHVHLARGQAAATRQLAAEAIEISEAIGNRLGTAAGLELVALAEVDRDPVLAARLLGAADAIRDKLGTPVEARDRALVDDARRRFDGSADWNLGATAPIDVIVRPLIDELR